MKRKYWNTLFKVTCTCSAFIIFAMLSLLLLKILHDGFSGLSWQFLRNFPSRFFYKAGIGPALMGSLWLFFLSALFSIPTSFALAIYLEEYLKKNSFMLSFLELMIATFSGIPSIVYGLLGLSFFVQELGMGRNLLTASLTLSLLLIPTLTIAFQNAFKNTAASIREAAYALGATKREVICGQIIPRSFSSIVSAVILGLSRSIGETAPLLVIGGVAFISYYPTSPQDNFTALPIQIYNWTSRPQADFHNIAASGIIVLLVIIFSFNALASYIRHQNEERNFK